MDTLELLIKGREVQANYGLAKGFLRDPETGAVCIQGALLGALIGMDMNKSYFARQCTGADWHEVQRGVEALGFATGGVVYDPNHVAMWNNDPERTLDEVLDRWDEGIANQRALREPALALA